MLRRRDFHLLYLWRFYFEMRNCVFALWFNLLTYNLELLSNWIIDTNHNRIFIFIVSALAQESFKCPDDYGFYPHHTSCDKYWKCDNGAAELKTCGNGLAFDAADPKYLSENCDYHHNVECGDRTQFGKIWSNSLFFSPALTHYKCWLYIHNILPPSHSSQRDVTTTTTKRAALACWKKAENLMHSETVTAAMLRSVFFISSFALLPQASMLF